MSVSNYAVPAAAYADAGMKPAGRIALIGIAVLVLALIALSVTSLLCGTVWLPPSALFGQDDSAHMARLILTDLRLPRLVLALLVGGALGFSGAVLQGLSRNALADPALLGVSAGAAFGAVMATYYGLVSRFPAAAPLLGLCGAGLAMLLTFAFGRGSTLALILAGAAVSALMAAFTGLALNLAPSPYAAYEMNTWLMGSLADKGWSQLDIAGPFILAGIALLATTGRGLDALSLGEAQAQSLGINLHRLNLLALMGTALAVGAATAVSGVIGFVGLIAPHLVRPMMGHQPGRLLWPSALAGGALVLAADIATRLIRKGPNIEVGVLTALVGAPFFFWLVVRVRRASL